MPQLNSKRTPLLLAKFIGYGWFDGRGWAHLTAWTCCSNCNAGVRLAGQAKLQRMGLNQYPEIFQENTDMEGRGSSHVLACRGTGNMWLLLGRGSDCEEEKLVCELPAGS